MIGGLGMPTQKAKDFKGTLVRLVAYLDPHRGALVVIVLTGAIGTVFSVLGPKILGLATTKIFEGFVAKSLRRAGRRDRLRVCRPHPARLERALHRRPTAFST